MHDPYSYEMEEDEEDPDQEPLWAAKATKTKGVGLGLGKGKTFSSGIGFSQTSQSQAKEFESKQYGYNTGGNFYKQQVASKDPYANYAQTTTGFHQGGPKQSDPYAFEAEMPMKQEKSSKKNGVKDIVPKRFGLRFDPPTIILEYLIPSAGKLYHHKMKLMKLKPDSEVSDALDYLKKKHQTYFSGGKLPDEQIIDKLKKRLQQQKGGGGKPQKQTPQQKSAQDNKTAITTQKDSKNVQIAKGSSVQPNSQANINFPPKQSSSLASTQQSQQSSLKQSQQKQQPQQQQLTLQQQKMLLQQQQYLQQQYDDGEDVDYEEEEQQYEEGEGEYEDGEEYDGEEEFEEIDYDNYDLNKLQTEELKKHKDKMEIQFKKNFVKPGDPGYQYDKQAEFDPTESNDWDHDEE